jgi:hypothetical protein
MTIRDPVKRYELRTRIRRPSEMLNENTLNEKPSDNVMQKTVWKIPLFRTN